MASGKMWPISHLSWYLKCPFTFLALPLDVFQWSWVKDSRGSFFIITEINDNVFYWSLRDGAVPVSTSRWQHVWTQGWSSSWLPRTFTLQCFQPDRKTKTGHGIQLGGHGLFFFLGCRQFSVSIVSEFISWWTQLCFLLPCWTWFLVSDCHTCLPSIFSLSVNHLPVLSLLVSSDFFVFCSSLSLFSFVFPFILFSDQYLMLNVDVCLLLWASSPLTVDCDRL